LDRPSAKEWSAALALYLVLTAAMTWPFASRLHTIDAGDSAFFVWAIGWQTHAINTDPASLPHGNFYAPSRYTYFMDEPVLGTGLLVLPLSWFTDDAILLFNVARLLTWILTGLFTWRFARDLGWSNVASLATGAFFAFSPIRVDQISHLSTLGTQWMPLVYLFGRRFCLSPNPGDAVRTGLFFALSFLACGYHGLFFAVLLPLSLLPLVDWKEWRRVVANFGVAVVTAALFLYPLYRLSRAALEPLGFERSNVDTLKYAASIETFFAASRWNRVWGGLTEAWRGDPSNLFPGLIVLGLAATAVWSWRKRDTFERRLGLALVVLVIAAAALALGPEVRFRGASLFPGPFALLREVVPVFTNIRATSRAGIFFAFALAMLAGMGLDRWRTNRIAVVAALGLFLLEARIAPIPTPSITNIVDSRDAIPPVYEWLKAQPHGTVLSELPSKSAADYSRPSFHDSIYMVRSTIHWLPLVNGFAGAETPMIRRFRETAPSFPDSESLDAMKAAGTKLVVVHMRGFGPNHRERIEAEVLRMKDRLREVARFANADRADIDVDVVYELDGPSR
jgi:hypothetical protein